MSLLEIRNLSVRFGDGDAVPVVDRLDLSVDKGEVLAIVGESGSGKSVTMLALMGLIDKPGRVEADSMNFAGHDLRNMNPRQLRKIPGEVAGEMWVKVTAEDGSWGMGTCHWGNLVEPLVREHYAPRTRWTIGTHGITFNDRGRGLGLVHQALRWAFRQDSLLSMVGAPLPVV
mgnify:CR=1 FL=1